MEASSKLRPVIAAQPSLQPFLDERLERNGLTIEGVAVLGDIFYAGFRSPSLEDGMSPLLSVRLDAIFGSQPAQPLNRWDCRWAKPAVFVRWRASREDCSFWPGQQLPKQEHSVHWWSPTTGGTQFLADITKPAEAGKDSKPEAIPPLDKSTSGLRLLVFSDGEKEGAPRPIVGPAPDTAAGELRCSRSLDRRKLEFSGFFMMASWARHRDSAT